MTYRTETLGTVLTGCAGSSSNREWRLCCAVARQCALTFLAVATEESGPFNLILMDIQMPEMDGFTATRHIRQWEGERGYRIPIIAMTANVMGGDRERCIQAGMDDYIPNPITKELMFEFVAKWKDGCSEVSAS